MELEFQTIRDFLIALFIGALVGIDREKRKMDLDFGGIGGLRTFILLAEAGALSAWLALKLDAMVIFATTGVMVVAASLVGYVMHARTMKTFPGMTTEVAAVVVFLLGGATLFGYANVAVALAIVTSVVLAYKQPLHGLVAKIGQDDFYAGLRLLVATFVVLPVLPNHAVDPWGTLNPYKVWLLVILIASISLIGYAVSRILGPRRGASLTGLFGGLVSSTAVALEYAKRSRQEDARAGLVDALAAGMMLSWVVMFGRILVAAGVVHGPLVRPLLAPMITLAVTTAVCGWVMYRRTVAGDAADAAHGVPLKNPFSLLAAAKFGLLFVAVLLVLKVVQQHAPGQGVYAVAILAGLTDVDAITLSMAEFARTGGANETAVTAIILAAASNTLSKCGIVMLLGSRELTQRILVVTLLLLAVAALFILV